MSRKKKIEQPSKDVNFKDCTKRILVGDWEYEVLEITSEVMKPIRNEHGTVRYVDIFRYMLKIMPQDHRDFDIISSLLTYINYQGGLTDKQVHLASRILDYWRLKGVCDA